MKRTGLKRFCCSKNCHDLTIYYIPWMKARKVPKMILRFLMARKIR